MSYVKVYISMLWIICMVSILNTYHTSHAKVIHFSTSEQSHFLSSNKALEKQVSSQEITEKYKVKFGQLETNINDRLNQLLEDAYEEYQWILQQEKYFLVFGLYKKYKETADQLETSSDQAFFKLYEQLVQELNSYGYNEDIAIPFKRIYEQTKSERKKQIKNKIINRIH